MNSGRPIPPNPCNLVGSAIFMRRVQCSVQEIRGISPGLPIGASRITAGIPTSGQNQPRYGAPAIRYYSTVVPPGGICALRLVAQDVLGNFDYALLRGHRTLPAMGLHVAVHEVRVRMWGRRGLQPSLELHG